MKCTIFKIPFYVLTLLMLARGYAQQKRMPLPIDYPLWGQADLKGVSPDGNVLFYALSYESGLDTLFVQRLHPTQEFAIPKGRFGKMSNSGLFACLKGSDLVMLTPEAAKLLNLGPASAFDFSREGNFLIGQSGSSLKVFDRNGLNTKTFEHVTDWQIAPDSNRLAVCVKKAGSAVLSIYDLDRHQQKDIYTLSQGEVSKPVFSENGEAVAFISYNSENGTNIHLYTGKLPLVGTKLPTAYAQYTLSPSNGLRITKDLKSVFLQLSTTKPTPAKGVAQLWNTADKEIYPTRAKKTGTIQRLLLWNSMEASFMEVTSEGLPMVTLLNDKNVLLWNPLRYEPQFDYAAPIDLYIKNLNDGSLKLFLEKHYPYMGTIQPSPKGNYIAYYKDGQWLWYDVAQNKHYNTGENTDILFQDTAYDIPGEPEAFGIAGWATDQKSFTVYDRYDLWKYTIASKKWERLTKGCEKNIKFRVAEPLKKGSSNNYNTQFLPPLAEENGIVLKAEGENGDSGYYLMDKRGKVNPIIYKSRKIDQLIRCGGNYVYRVQDFDSPPFFYRTHDGKTNCVAKTNKHHQGFYWGTSESISYNDQEKGTLKSVLCFPPGYDPTKKYPMIVSVYEKQSRELHNFSIPTVTPVDGFNIAAFLNEGYLVLLPDIHYTVGEPGPSALYCTLAAVNHVLEMGIADPGRIGLIGHSFGGYESNYIISRSDIFAAAVSGAPANDLLSFYLSVNWDTGKPNIWRMEHQQWRLGMPYYKNLPAYLENSPVINAHSITTPLLSWAGDQDFQVDWHQNIELYLALRRLGKEHILLLYPDEGHNIYDRSKREDLCKKILSWFGHYLKNEPKPVWAMPN